MSVLMVVVGMMVGGATSDCVGQWMQTGGPYDENISCFAFNDNYAFVGSQVGVFRSSNDGKDWAAINTGLTHDTVLSLLTSGANLIAGTVHGGVYLSTNNGISWAPSNSGLPTNISINALVVKGKYLCAGTSNGLFRSSNNGYDWSEQDSGFTGSYVSAFAIIGSNLFGVDPSYGVSLSTNTGSSWIPANHGVNSYYCGISAIAAMGTNLIIGTGNCGFYRSTDSGKSWMARNSGFPSYVRVYAFAIMDTNLFAGTDDGLFVSSDSGKSWKGVYWDEFTHNFIALAVSGTDLFAATNGGGVLISTNDGIDWTPIKTRLTITQTRALGVSGTNLFAGTPFGVMRSTNFGTDWAAASTGLQPNIYVFAIAAIGANIFAGTDSGVFISTDNGVNWTSSKMGFPSHPWTASLATIGSTVFAGTDYGVFRSTDSGTSWHLLQGNLPGVYAIATSGSNLFAGGSNVYLSTDGGMNWNDASIRVKHGDIRTLATLGHKVFAGCWYPGGFFCSTNNGLVWIADTSGLTASGSENNIYSSLVSGSNIFLGAADRGVYLSTDSGTSWCAVNDGLLGGPINSLVIAGIYLFAGTDDGVWRRPLSEMIPTNVVAPARAVVARSIAAYPNPFTSSATISFTVSESGAAQVRVVNMLGVEVARLFDGEMEAGERQFTWDAHSFAPGVYWCEVRMNGRVERTAVVLER